MISLSTKITSALQNAAYMGASADPIGGSFSFIQAGVTFEGTVGERQLTMTDEQGVVWTEANVVGAYYKEDSRGPYMEMRDSSVGVSSVYTRPSLPSNAELYANGNNEASYFILAEAQGFGSPHRAIFRMGNNPNARDLRANANGSFQSFTSRGSGDNIVGDAVNAFSFLVVSEANQETGYLNNVQGFQSTGLSDVVPPEPASYFLQGEDWNTYHKLYAFGWWPFVLDASQRATLQAWVEANYS